MSTKTKIEILILTAFVAWATFSLMAQAEVDYLDGELHEVDATAYCDSGLTSTGCQVREGICAFDPKYYGCVALIYDAENLELIGLYEVKDTGSVKYGIRTGKTIDIWMPTREQCLEFGRRKVLVQIVKGWG